MVPMAEQLLIMGALIGAFWTYADLFRRFPALGWFLLSAYVISMWEYQNLPAIASVAGLSIYPVDALTGGMLYAVVLNWRKVSRAMDGRGSMMLVLVAGFAFSMLRGAAAFGPGLMVNEARTTLQLISVVAWVLMQSGEERFPERLRKFWLYTSWALLAVTVIHLGMYGVGSASSGQILVNGEFKTDRPLVSTQAVFLSLAAFAMLMGKRHRILPWFLFLAVLVCQHRSVWIATLAGFCVIVATGLSRQRWKVLIGGTVALTVGASVILYGLLPDFIGKLSESVQSTQTLTGRNEGWQVLVTRLNEKGWLYRLIGDAWGTGWRRFEANMTVDFSPHNWYVTIYLRTGLIGVVSLAVILITALRRQSRAGNRVPLVWLAALSVYAVPYSIDWALGPFLAVALIAHSPGSGEQAQVVRADVERPVLAA